jgi:ribose transport system permease protein
MTALTLPRLTLSGELKAIGHRLLAVVALCIVLSFLSGAFFTSGNILNVLRQAALIFLLASGSRW